MLEQSYRGLKANYETQMNKICILKNVCFQTCFMFFIGFFKTLNNQSSVKQMYKSDS